MMPLILMTLINIMCVMLTTFCNPDSGCETCTGNKLSHSQKTLLCHIPLPEKHQKIFIFQCLKIYLHCGYELAMLSGVKILGNRNYLIS